MMAQSEGVPRKKYSLFVLGLIMLAIGGVTLGIGYHNYVIRSVGVIACLLSVYLIRVSNVHSRAAGRGDSEARNRPGLVMWIVGVVSLVLLAISFYGLYNDAISGYHDITPVYAFAGMGMVCAAVWGYLISKILGK